MDVFDTSSYFSHRVPALASKSELLKNSVCAVAAKHQQRISDLGKNSPTCYRPITSPSESPHQDIRREYLSAGYYQKAIERLKVAVNSLGFDEGLVRSSHPPEEIFAAIAILCMYELMDAPGVAWRAHLSALPLFVPHPDTESEGSPTVTIPRNTIKGPIFWSLARQDILCACVGETQTRLKLEDMRFWHNAGLASSENCFQLPFSPGSFADNHGSTDIEEDAKGNHLVGILSEIINFITSGDALDPKDYARPPGQRLTIGVTQEQLLMRWHAIIVELEHWHASLPKSFTPKARTRAVGKDGSPSGSDFDNFQQIWYDLPACAATMQCYHMACILMLANRPQESTAIRSTVSARLQSYRQDQQRAYHHARELCGIALAETSDSVRVHSVQPLFVAGQVFYREEEQRIVIDLLSDIENDLGWPTAYYIQKLKDEWYTVEGANLQDLLSEEPGTFLTPNSSPEHAMPNRLQSKVAIVTGSSSGLGRAIALAYASEGAAVVCADLKPEARAEVTAEGAIHTDEQIRRDGGRVIFVKTDVSVARDVENLVLKAVSEFGRVDILVNNAGISIEANRPPAGVHETPEETWDTTMAVNAKSVFLGSKYAIAQMLRQEVHSSGHRGWIINMSSIFGLVGGRYNVSYAASKAAVSNLTKQVAMDYAEHRIHCNAICPGYTRTAIFANTIQNLDDVNDIQARHPFGGVGTPQDIVGAAIFLASDEAGWITGICLPVDGGYTAQ
ncbi:hypothetical protein DL769_007579 [Monosporascus sp. CRB-8-3]|nr:hypothetical protein DL769_007579 [Monosporascus sp. CRB-8-3]